jgi:hypothetical protein
MKRPTLLTQVLAVNALLITATVFAASVAASLHSDPLIERKRFLVLTAALMAMVLVNAWLLRRRFAPLEELIAAMERVDFGGRDPRSAIPTANVEEVARLHTAFDRMLERLEAERDRTATAVLKAQEGERARLARDLHDEANQALTGVLLRLEATAQDAPPELREELRETKRVATQAMDELVRLARELRPVALDDLGLGAALPSAWRTSTPTSRSWSTASSRRGCRTWPATRARAACASRSSARRAGPWCGWQTTGRASPRARRRRGSGSRACASAPCWPAGASASSRRRAAARRSSCGWGRRHEARDRR